MTRAIDVTGNPILERHARIIFFKLSKNPTSSIEDFKHLGRCRGLDFFDSSIDFANLLTTLQFYIDEGIVAPVLESDFERKIWRDYLSGDLECEQLLDTMKFRFRRRQRNRYAKHEIAFLRVLDR